MHVIPAEIKQLNQQLQLRNQQKKQAEIAENWRNSIELKKLKRRISIATEDYASSEDEEQENSYKKSHKTELSREFQREKKITVESQDQLALIPWGFSSFSDSSRHCCREK